MLEVKALLAGLEKFGPYKCNAAECLVDRLNGELIEINQNVRIRIVGLKLPINFRTFRKVLSEGLSRIKPQVATGLGMDFKDLNHLSLELLAHREPQYGSDITDVEGRVGSDCSLDRFSIEMRLPNEEQIKHAITDVSGIELSENAGRHMCETVLRDLTRLSQNGVKFQPMFIHLPHTPDMLTDSEKLVTHKKSMPLEQQIKILRFVLKKVVESMLCK